MQPFGVSKPPNLVGCKLPTVAKRKPSQLGWNFFYFQEITRGWNPDPGNKIGLKRGLGLRGTWVMTARLAGNPQTSDPRAVRKFSP